MDLCPLIKLLREFRGRGLGRPNCQVFSGDSYKAVHPRRIETLTADVF